MSNQAVYEEAKRLQQSALVEFYTLDFTPLGGELMRFFKGSNSNEAAIVWQTHSYLPYPCELSDVGTQSKGAAQRPTLAMSNALGLFSSLCATHRDCVGVKFTRIRTYARFLDGQPDADPTAMFPPDVYIINQKKSEGPEIVSFELTSPSDVEDAALPSRLFIQNVCAWRYRGGECPYSYDNVVMDSDGNEFPDPKNARGAYSVAATYLQGDYAYVLGPDGVRSYYYCHAAPEAGFTGSSYAPPNSSFWTPDQCPKTVVACQKHFGTRGGGLPYGGFPAVIRLG